MKKKLLLLPILGVLLAGCTGGPSSSTTSESVTTSSTTSQSSEPDFTNHREYKIISPAGAPSLAFYEYASSENFVTNTSVPVVLAAFATQENDVIVMDHTTGIKQITTNNAQYQLARIITKGNFHLVGVGKDANAVPTATSKIVSFGGAAGMPNQILFKVFPEIDKSTVQYVEGVALTVPVIKTGKYNAENVDFVLTAQPILNNILTSTGYPTEGTLMTIDMQAKWHELSNLDGFPQSGLFVKKSLHDDDNEYLEHFLTKFDAAVYNTINNPQKVADALTAYGDSAAQKAKFGLDATIFMQLQGPSETAPDVKPNQIGLHHGSYSLVDYLNYMGQQQYPASVFSSHF